MIKNIVHIMLRITSRQKSFQIQTILISKKKKSMNLLFYLKRKLIIFYIMYESQTLTHFHT